jgi:hypothetical protein
MNELSPSQHQTRHFPLLVTVISSDMQCLVFYPMKLHIAYMSQVHCEFTLLCLHMSTCLRVWQWIVGYLTLLHTLSLPYHCHNLRHAMPLGPSQSHPQTSHVLFSSHPRSLSPWHPSIFMSYLCARCHSPALCLCHILPRHIIFLLHHSYLCHTCVTAQHYVSVTSCDMKSLPHPHCLNTATSPYCQSGDYTLTVTVTSSQSVTVTSRHFWYRCHTLRHAICLSFSMSHPQTCHVLFSS